jgi:hypothetical protein
MTDIEEPLKLQKQNIQDAIANLKETYAQVEKLIQRTYLMNDMDANSSLRFMRNEISRLIAEMGQNGLSNFNGQHGNLEEFYQIENKFIQGSKDLLDFATSLTITQQIIDVTQLENYLKQLEKDFNRRVSIDSNILFEFEGKKDELNVVANNSIEFNSMQDVIESGNDSSFNDSVGTDPVICAEDNRKEDIDANTLSKICSYFNILEHKYSCCRPEISNNGDYIADKKWGYEVSNKRITGTIKNGIFRNLLVFETYWNPTEDIKDLISSIQSCATNVSKNQYMSLCLVNCNWQPEIIEWCKGFMHSRLSLFLYSLDTDELHFNNDLDASMNLHTWHDSDTEVELLEVKLQKLAKENDYFDAKEVARFTGLNIKGSEIFLKELTARKIVVDIGFGTSKYTLSKE